MANKVTFVNIDYDGIQIAEYGDDYPVKDDWPFLIEELANSGFKVTVSTSHTGTGKSATITDKRDKTVNTGMILTAWGADVPSAVSKAYFAVSEASRLELDWVTYKTNIGKESTQNLKDYKAYMEWKRARGKPE